MTVQSKTIYYKYINFAKKELIKEEVMTNVSKARFPCCTAGGAFVLSFSRAWPPSHRALLFCDFGSPLNSSE